MRARPSLRPRANNGRDSPSKAGVGVSDSQWTRPPGRSAPGPSSVRLVRQGYKLREIALTTPAWHNTVLGSWQVVVAVVVVAVVVVVAKVALDGVRATRGVAGAPRKTQAASTRAGTPAAPSTRLLTLS